MSQFNSLKYKNDYFSADLHLGHANIIKYTHRPFLSDYEKEALSRAEAEIDPIKQRDAIRNVRLSDETVKKHDDTVINNINSVVNEDDRLFILGDFAFVKTVKDMSRYYNRIKCKNIILIMGNHDKSHLINPVFPNVYDQLVIKSEGKTITLNHYAMMVWDRSHFNSWSLFGHTHNTLHSLPGTFSCDVGVDAWDFKPVSMSDLRAFMNKKDIHGEQGYFRKDGINS